MGLSDEQVRKYQKIHKSVFGKEISTKDAYDQGIKLVRLLSIIYTPMTEEEFSVVEATRKALLPGDALH
jgi:hypothetical protein